MTTTDEPDAIAELPLRAYGLTIDQMHALWNAEWACIRRWQYEVTHAWALHPDEPEDEVKAIKLDLWCKILTAIEATHDLEDALVWVRKVKPTDIPQPWGGAL